MKLHLGSGERWLPGWINLDLARGHDLRRGLPQWSENEALSVYSCHFLEHLSHAEGRFLLQEVHRVLQPGGVVRLGVPDFAVFAQAYVRGDSAFQEQYFRRYCHPVQELPPSMQDHGAGSPHQYEGLGPLSAILAVTHAWGHRALYDEGVLRTLLLQAGFPEASIHRCQHGQSFYYESCPLDHDFEDHTLWMEAEKPLT